MKKINQVRFDPAIETQTLPPVFFSKIGAVLEEFRDYLQSEGIPEICRKKIRLMDRENNFLEGHRFVGNVIYQYADNYFNTILTNSGKLKCRIDDQNEMAAKCHLVDLVLLQDFDIDLSKIK
jgi:hypothetical protein